MRVVIDLGLAGTGPGQDQQGAFGMVDGPLLRWIEFFHWVGCSTDYGGDANREETATAINELQTRVNTVQFQPVVSFF